MTCITDAAAQSDHAPVEVLKIKRTRADRSEKLKRRKVTVETVVKASLLKHLRGDDKQQLRQAIQERVDVFSQRYHIASVALSGMLKKCFHGVHDVRSAQLPDLTCQTFFRQLMLGVDGAVKADLFVKAYYSTHPRLADRLRRPEHLQRRVKEIHDQLSQPLRGWL